MRVRYADTSCLRNEYAIRGRKEALVLIFLPRDGMPLTALVQELEILRGDGQQGGSLWLIPPGLER